MCSECGNIHNFLWISRESYFLPIWYSLCPFDEPLSYTNASPLTSQNAVCQVEYFDNFSYSSCMHLEVRDSLMEIKNEISFTRGRITCFLICQSKKTYNENIIPFQIEQISHHNAMLMFR
jgi:hypothetical protein